MAEELTFLRFERLDGVMVAAFREKPSLLFPKRGRPILFFRRESLEIRAANLKAAGDDASTSEKALREWPSG